MAELFGDAFHEDREIRVYGKDITESRSVIPFTDLADCAESKSNNVSFMKVEDLDENCRNLLLTSDNFVCYSVTQKRNVLRAIDTITGEKTILKGHEAAILDLSLCPIDHSLFCSVDSSSATAGPHIIVWKKDAERFGFTKVAESNIRAMIVEAHPTIANTWAIADKDHIAIFSPNHPADLTCSSIIDLTIHFRFDQGTISNIAFSPDGNYLAVTVMVSETQSFLQILRVPSISQHSSQFFTPIFSDYASLIKLDNIVAMRCLETAVLVVTRADKLSFNFDASSNAGDFHIYEIRCYSLSEPSQKVIQTVLLALPAHKSRNSAKPSSTLKNPFLDCALAIETHKRRFGVLASRRSGYVVILGLREASQGWPIHHVALLNLRAPVVSQSVSTILGREHHSFIEDEYLEISAYQEEASEQASIQQYHIHLLQVTPLTPSPSTSAKLSPEKGQTILGLLKSVSDGSLAGMASENGSKESKSMVSDLRDAGSSTAIHSAINNTSISAMKPIGSKSKLLDSTTDSPAPGPTVSTPTGAAAVAVEAPEPPSTAPTKLKKLDSSKLFGNTSTGATTVTVPPPATADDLPPFLAQAANKSTPILQMLKPKPASAMMTATAPQPTPPVTVSAPAVAAALAPVTIPAPTTAAAVPSEASTFTPVALRTGSTPTATVGAGKHLTDSSEHAKLAHTVDNMYRSFNESINILTQEIMRQKSVDGGHHPAQPNNSAALQAMKEEIIKEMTRLHAKTANQLSIQVQSTVEMESKKILSVLEAQKQELSTHLQEVMISQVLPSLTNKLRESAKESVKQSLTQSFRVAFENVLVPAYQAGTDRMFAQVSNGFEQGMRNVSLDFQQMVSGQQQHYLALQQEVTDLKTSMQQLTQLVQQLVSRPGGNNDGNGAIHGAVAMTPTPPSALDLVKAGRINEGVREALNAKDMDVMLTVLELLTPQQVTTQCSHLTRLCITQQLAADMSENMPKEGLGKRVEWIKSLVLSLLSIPLRTDNAEDVSFARHFKSMIAVVLESIKAAQEMIVQSQFDNGEDSDNAVVIPQSASTDLQLLYHLIQAKI